MPKLVFLNNGATESFPTITASSGLAGQVPETAFGGALDPTLIPSVSVSDGTGGLIPQTDATGKLDLSFLPDLAGGASSLDDLTDVTSTGAAEGQVLAFLSGSWSPLTLDVPTTMPDLTDVDTTGAIDGDVLTYSAGSWSPSALPAAPTYALDDLTDVTPGTPSVGDLLSYSASGWVSSTPASAAVLPETYTAAGQVTVPKTFAGFATSDGSSNWSIDLSAAGFTTVHGFSATALQAGTNVETAPVASAQTFNTTTLAGTVIESKQTAVFLGGSAEGMENAGSGVQIYCVVIGE